MPTDSLQQWLQQASPVPVDVLQEMAGDASFRRYFRMQSGQQSYVVMDASLQLDCCEPYVAIAKALHPMGVAVPEIMAQDLKQGYMIISDFGDRLYLKELRPDNADTLYKTALDSLALLQACREVKDWPLPAFDQAFMQRELDEFKHWFLEGYLKLALSSQEEKMLQTTCHLLTEAASLQTQVFIHRDYHSANLLVVPTQGNRFQTGILDFQDACTGPVTYDLVSLLRDCYISWPDEKIYRWVGYYYERLREDKLLQTVDFNQFIRWFDWMGMQRHLKALFIFTRKYLRDKTPRYLQHVPRTLNYVVSVSGRYPEFKAFHAYLDELAGALEGLAPCVE